MTDNILNKAKEILLIESQSVKDQIKNINGKFLLSVDTISKCSGRVVVMGVGKSGIISRKISATMSSLGIPSVFLHPAECLHGDIGMLMIDDVVIMLSYTGESEEIKKVMPVIKNLGIKIIVITGRPTAKIWRYSDFIINSKIKKEACPFNLAPTASTSAMLALGDALAICASLKKGFQKETLARFHPSGGLGKKLTIKVKDLMHSGKNNPIIHENRTVNEALIIMTTTRLGAANVVNHSGKLVGFFTDGDLRRKLQSDKQLMIRKLSDIINKTPITINPDALAAEAARLLKKHNFDNIPVVNKQGKPVGIIDERDLFAEGIV